MRFALLLCLASQLAAGGEALRVRHFARDSGLPANTVQALAHGAEGALWIGTEEGLARFDGTRMWYPVPWLGGFPRASVEALLAEGARLWVAVRPGGLARVQGAQWSWAWVPEGGGGVYTLFLARGGGVWAASVDGEVVQVAVDGKVARRLRVPGGDVVLAGVEAPDGSVWLGTQRGLWLHPAAAGEPAQVLAGTVTAVVWVGGQEVWAAERRQGLFRVRPQAPAQRLFTAAELQLEELSSLLPLSQDQLLVGGGGGVVAVSTRGEKRKLLALPGDSARCLAAADGTIWVGTQESGLFALDSGPVWAPLPGVRALSVAAGDGGEVWVGSDAGVYLLRGERRSFVPLPSEVWALAPLPAGGVAAGTWGRGVFLIQGDPPKVTVGPLCGEAKVRALAAQRNSLWVGTTTGLYLVRGEQGRWAQEAVIPGLSISVLKVGPGGELWVGTRRRGLAVIRHGTVRWIAGVKGLGAPAVTALVPLGDETLVGTLGAGVARVKGLELHLDQVISAQLPSRNVATLEVDPQGKNLWVGTNFGLAVVPVAAEGGQGAALLQKGDGLPSEAAIGVAGHGCTRQGELLWLVTEGGLAVVRMDALAARPRLRVEQVLVDGKPVAVAALGALPPGEHEVAVDVACLALDLPGAVRLWRRWEPNGAWEPMQPGRLALGRLRAGEHRLLLRATPSPGAEVGLRIGVLPPWYRRSPWWQVLAAMAAACIAAGFLAYRRRWRVRWEEVQRRMELARRAHDTAGSLAAGVMLHLQAAMAARDQASAAALQRALDLAVQAAEELRAIARVLRAGPKLPGREDSGEKPSLAASLARLSVAGKPPEDAELEVIAAELVMNALRHTPRGRVQVEFLEREGEVGVRVFQEEPPGGSGDAPGLGLPRMLQAVQRRRGSWELVAVGKGLAITVRLPRARGGSG